MLFLDTNDAAKDLKDAFVEGIDQGRRKAHTLASLTPKERDKISFFCLPSGEQSPEYQAALEILRRRDAAATHLSDPFEAYWSFEMASGLHIGFIGVLDENKENIRNLNLHDSVRKAQQFKTLWSTLHETRE